MAGGLVVEAPASSPDFTSPDFFLWVKLDDICYRDSPTRPENMRQRIVNACENITEGELLAAERNFVTRIAKCIEVEERHFEHLSKS